MLYNEGSEVRKMAGYSELIKNFERVRAYIREFYVYGCKGREEAAKKSARTYDNEKRRIESWLHEYMGARRDREGKTVFLSLDSRRAAENPFFRAFAAKSFTDADITLHFLLFDILLDGERTQAQLTEEISSRLNAFDEPLPFDESTLRKKLGEYADKGLLRKRADGRRVLYSLPPSPDLAPLRAALEFFSETAPLGEPGAFLLDKLPSRPSPFRFKHHYVTGTPDDEILLFLFEAMRDKKRVLLHKTSRKKENECTVVPLCVGAGVQSGRRYLFAWEPAHKCFRSFRLDFILRVKALDVCENFDKLREKFNNIRPYIWGASLGGSSKKELVQFTLKIEKGEEYILRRLLRERRGGSVEQTGENEWTFRAEVFDSEETLGWIRTFTGRILSLDFSDRTVENKFKEDLRAMYRLYGLEE